jgi:hypothetical protein
MFRIFVLKEFVLLVIAFLFKLKVAERVAAERAESCGNGNSTGYQIRLQR